MPTFWYSSAVYLGGEQLRMNEGEWREVEGLVIVLMVSVREVCGDAREVGDEGGNS